MRETKCEESSSSNTFSLSFYVRCIYNILFKLFRGIEFYSGMKKWSIPLVIHRHVFLVIQLVSRHVIVRRAPILFNFMDKFLNLKNSQGFIARFPIGLDVFLSSFTARWSIYLCSRRINILRFLNVEPRFYSILSFLNKSFEGDGNFFRISWIRKISENRLWGFYTFWKTEKYSEVNWRSVMWKLGNQLLIARVNGK